MQTSGFFAYGSNVTHGFKMNLWLCIAALLQRRGQAENRVQVALAKGPVIPFLLG